MVSCYGGATTMVVCLSGFERLSVTSNPMKKHDGDLRKPISVVDLPCAARGQESTRDEMWNAFYDGILVPVAKTGRYHYTPFGRTDIKTRDEFLQQHFCGMTCEEVKVLARAHRVSLFSQAVNDHPRAASCVFDFMHYYCGMSCEVIKDLADAFNVPLFIGPSGDTCCLEFSW